MFFRSKTVVSLGLLAFACCIAVGKGEQRIPPPRGDNNDKGDSPEKRHNEYVVLEEHTKRENYHSPLPHTYIEEDDLPVRTRTTRWRS